MRTMGEWLEGARHLPPFLRDFHDQKDFFKWMWRKVEAAKAKDASLGTYLCGVTWTAAHVFVIDHFLWWMAMHGYTLQRCRSRDDFADIKVAIRQMKDEDAAAFRKMLDERSAAPTPGDAPTDKSTG